jgi:hypothetical protein
MPLRDPSFSILYADLKAGKTSDVLAAFPRGVYIAAPGALAPAESLWGFEVPKRYDLETFKAVEDFASTLGPEHLALIIDDATLIADRTGVALARKGLGGWDLWAAVLRQAISMRDVLRRRGLHIVMTAHPRAAHVENGVRLRGGPSFQGQCYTKIPAAADFLLRAEAREGGGIGWPMVYRTAYSPDWLQGSRYGTPDASPMNLGECLRLAGYTIPRLPGLEWQEGLADALAREIWGKLGDAEKVKSALSKVKEYALKKYGNEAHVYWAIRDGYDRAVLWTARASQRSDLWGV